MPKLTKRLVNSLKPRTSDLFMWDAEVRGFGLRVKPSGRKSYIVQYRNGRQESRRLTVGAHGIYTPETARNRARELLRDAHNGGDPAARRKAARNAPAAPTMRNLAERFLVAHAATKKKASSARMDRVNFDLHVLPAFGSRPVAELTRADITHFHHGMAEKPGAANRVLALLSKAFNLAEQWGWRADGTNPCRHVERYPEHKMERFLTGEEMARLGAALADAEHMHNEPSAAIAAIRLLAFTGARLGEILTLQWDHVDIERRCLFLSDSKTGPKIIHLNAPAREVLSGIKRHHNLPYVIAGAVKGKPLVNLRKPWHRIRKKAGLGNVRLHDLRHSFASIGASGGLSLPIIGGLLGHTQPATTARYAHLAANPLQQAADMIGRRIAAAMAGRSGKVIRLPRNRRDRCA